MKFLPGYFNVVIVEMEAFKIVDALSFSNALDEFFFTRRDMDEPKVIVFGPQETSFSGEFVNSSRVSKMPIQELFLSDLSDLI